MATLLDGIKKLIPGRLDDIAAFNKAMSKLASYTHSPKYEQVLKSMLESGDVKVEGENQEKATRVTAPVVEAPVSEVVTHVATVEPEVKADEPAQEAVEAPPETVTPAVAETVAEKSLVKKKR